MREKYAYSIKTERVRETDFPYNGQRIDGTQSLYDFLRSLQRADNEKFITIYLDVRNQVVGLQVTEGSVNYVPMPPRNIIRHALLLNVSAIIIAHNHPSGNLQPSKEDIQFTETLIESAKHLDINVHDHLIIAGDTGAFFSMRETGTVKFN